MNFSPALTFSLMLGSTYGIVAHLILGGNVRRMFVYILASLIGFAIGQGVGQVMAINSLAMGQINILPATLGAIIAIITGAFLSAG